MPFTVVGEAGGEDPGLVVLVRWVVVENRPVRRRHLARRPECGNGRQCIRRSSFLKLGWTIGPPTRESGLGKADALFAAAISRSPGTPKKETLHSFVRTAPLTSRGQVWSLVTVVELGARGLSHRQLLSGSIETTQHSPNKISPSPHLSLFELDHLFFVISLPILVHPHLLQVKQRPGKRRGQIEARRSAGDELEGLVKHPQNAQSSS